jgi:hypothetical protein
MQRLAAAPRSLLRLLHLQGYRRAATGRRDLAMLSLMARMRLRGEVAGLALDDIDWCNGGAEMTGLPDPAAAFCLDLVVPGEAEPVSRAAAGASGPAWIRWQRTAVSPPSAAPR